MGISISLDPLQTNRQEEVHMQIMSFFYIEETKVNADRWLLFYQTKFNSGNEIFQVVFLPSPMLTEKTCRSRLQVRKEALMFLDVILP